MAIGYDVTIYPKTVLWNGLTFGGNIAAGDLGGLLAVHFFHDSQDLPDRTGDQEYPTFMAMVNKFAMVQIGLRQVKEIVSAKGNAGTFTAIGVKSDMVVTLIGKSASTPITNTVPGLVFKGVQASQMRAQPGESALTFVHESVDGLALPWSN